MTYSVLAWCSLSSTLIVDETLNCVLMTCIINPVVGGEWTKIPCPPVLKMAHRSMHHLYYFNSCFFIIIITDTVSVSAGSIDQDWNTELMPISWFLMNIGQAGCCWLTSVSWGHCMFKPPHTWRRMQLSCSRLQAPHQVAMLVGLKAARIDARSRWGSQRCVPSDN